MRKIKLFVVCFLLWIVFLPTTDYLLPAVYAVGATLSLSPALGNFNKGCAFSIDITLDTGGAQTDGTDAIIFYDTSRLTAVKIRPGTIYSDYPGNVIDAQRGRIAVSGISPLTSSFSGQGALASIDFTVNANASVGATKITFDFDPANKTKTTDSNVAEKGTVTEILSQVNDGSYTIGVGACGAVSATPTPVGGGRGSPIGTGSATVTPIKTPYNPNPLPEGADFNSTLTVAITGSILVILGILGLALL